MAGKTTEITEVLKDAPRNWGRWGANDEIGGLNFLTSEEVLRGIHAVKQGRVPRGAYLIIENLDRLTREHIQPALLLVLGLLRHVVVCSLECSMAKQIWKAGMFLCRNW